MEHHVICGYIDEDPHIKLITGNNKVFGSSHVDVLHFLGLKLRNAGHTVAGKMEDNLHSLDV